MLSFLGGCPTIDELPYVFIYFEWPKVNINKGRDQNNINQTDDT